MFDWFAGWQSLSQLASSSCSSSSARSAFVPFFHLWWMCSGTCMRPDGLRSQMRRSLACCAASVSGGGAPGSGTVTLGCGFDLAADGVLGLGAFFMFFPFSWSWPSACEDWGGRKVSVLLPAWVNASSCACNFALACPGQMYEIQVKMFMIDIQRFLFHT